MVNGFLENGRKILSDIREVEPYMIPDVKPNNDLVTSERPRANDPYAVLYVFCISLSPLTQL